MSIGHLHPTIGSDAHDALVAHFDKTDRSERADKEARNEWARGNVYQDGRRNERFKAFLSGYSYALALARMEERAATEIADMRPDLERMHEAIGKVLGK